MTKEPPQYTNATELESKPRSYDHDGVKEGILVSGWSRRLRRFSGQYLYYAVCLGGVGQLSCPSGVYDIPPRHYARFGGPGSIKGGSGILIGIKATPRWTVLGRIPDRGVLKYKPGGRMATLCFPETYGEPSLNLLDMEPWYKDQDDHYHPALRVNIMIEGEVECFTHVESPRRLVAGDVIILPSGVYHRFVTGESGMKFVAFHPDSEFGPTEDNNTMLNKTVY